MGLREFRELSIRLFGINAPEIHVTAQHDAAVAARAHLEQLLDQPSPIGPLAYRPIVVRTHKDQADKYGDRWEGVIWLESDGLFDPFDFHFVTTQPSINDRMVAAGMAVEYHGGKR